MPAMKLRRNDQCLICPCHGHAHFDPNVEKTSALGRQRTRMQSQHPHRMAPGSMDTESCLLDVRCLPSLNKQRCARRCMDGILKICKSKDTQWQTIGESILDGDCHRAQLQSLPTDVDSMNIQGLAEKQRLWISMQSGREVATPKHIQTSVDHRGNAERDNLLRIPNYGLRRGPSYCGGPRTRYWFLEMQVQTPGKNNCSHSDKDLPSYTTSQQKSRTEMRMEPRNGRDPKSACASWRQGSKSSKRAPSMRPLFVGNLHIMD